MVYPYTNVEYCEMVRMLARCKDNVTEAVRRYREQFGGSVTNRTMMGATQRLREFGTFHPPTGVDLEGRLRNINRYLKSKKKKRRKPEPEDTRSKESNSEHPNNEQPDNEHSTANKRKKKRRKSKSEHSWSGVQSDNEHSKAKKKKRKRINSESEHSVRGQIEIVNVHLYTDDIKNEVSEHSDNEHSKNEQTYNEHSIAMNKKIKRSNSESEHSESEPCQNEQSDNEHIEHSEKDGSPPVQSAITNSTKEKLQGSGLTRPYKLSPELAELLGVTKIPKPEVVKRLWGIIKQKNLYDPDDRKFAICDDALYKVIGTKRFRTLNIMQYLNTHFVEE